MTIDQFVQHLNNRFGLGDQFAYTVGKKYTRLYIRRGRLRSTYCFIDDAGNIYKPASWAAPAKGVRSTLDTVKIEEVDEYGSWLYRR
jgi:hypothetical protein